MADIDYDDYVEVPRYRLIEIANSLDSLAWSLNTTLLDSYIKELEEMAGR